MRVQLSPLRTTLLAMALATMSSSTLSIGTARAQTGGECEFVLGFRTLHDSMADVVGTCISDEMFDPMSGRSVQPTTGGLLILRKSYNWLGFTNPSSTWVAVSTGLERRANEERLPWELAIPPSPTLAARCDKDATELADELATFGSTDGLTRTLRQSCQREAVELGELGVDCFEWSAWKVTNNGEGSPEDRLNAAAELHQSCVNEP